MSEIILNDPLASQLREEAEAQGVAVENFIESALRHYRFQLQRDKINSESSWWHSQAASMHQRYKDQFVAIHNQQLVDHDHDEQKLRERIRVTYGKTAVLITPAERRLELRIVSTRLARI